MSNALRYIFSLLLAASLAAITAGAQEQRDTTLVGDAALGPRRVHLYAPHVRPMSVRQSYLVGSYSNQTSLSGDAAVSMFPKDSDWDILVFGHADGYLQKLDLNEDLYQDNPTQINATLGTGWLRTGENGTKILLGARAMLSNKLGGQIQTDDVPSVIFSRDKVRTYISGGAWKACVLERSADAYAEVIKPLNKKSSLDVSVDYSFQTMTSTFGNENKLPQLTAIYYGRYSTVGPNIICRIFDTDWHSAFAKAEYSTKLGRTGSYSILASEKYDASVERFCKTYDKTYVNLSHTSLAGRFNYISSGRTLKVSPELGVDYLSGDGVYVVPAVDMKWTPGGVVSVNASVSRDVRRTWALMDNLQTLVSCKDLTGHFAEHPVQDMWNAGVSATVRLPYILNSYFKLKANRTQYAQQLLLDYDSSSTFDKIDFVLLSDMEDGTSYVNVLSAELGSTPLPGLDFAVSGFLRDSKETLPGRGLVTTPLVSSYGASAELHYKTRHRILLLDVKATLNGPSKVWDCMNTRHVYEDGMTPSYVLLDARVAHRFGDWEFFVDGSNLLGYIQPVLYLNQYSMFHYGFDGSLIWAPTTGRKVVAGARVNIFNRRR